MNKSLVLHAKKKNYRSIGAILVIVLTGCTTTRISVDWMKFINKSAALAKDLPNEDVEEVLQAVIGAIEAEGLVMHPFRRRIFKSDGQPVTTCSTKPESGSFGLLCFSESKSDFENYTDPKIPVIVQFVPKDNIVGIRMIMVPDSGLSVDRLNRIKSKVAVAISH